MFSPRFMCIVELHIATFLLGFSALIAKMIQLPVTFIVLGRSVIAAFALLVIVVLSRQSMSLQSKRDYMIFFIKGALLCIHWMAYFYSAKVSTVAVAMLSLFTFPVLTTMLEPYFFKEHLDWRDVLSAFMVLAGVLLIVPELNFSNAVTQGVAWGLLSSLAYSVRNIVSRKYVQVYPSSVMMVYQTGVTAVITAALWMILPFNVDMMSFDQVNIGLLLVLGVVITALAHTLVVRSLKHLRARTASVITSLQPLYGIMLAFWIIGEAPQFSTIIGGGVICIAVLIEMVKKRSLADID